MELQNLSKKITKCPFHDCLSDDLEYLEPNKRRDLILISCSNCKREFSIVESALECFEIHEFALRFSDFDSNKIHFRCIKSNCKNKFKNFYDFEAREINLIKFKLPTNLEINNFKIRPRVIRRSYENSLLKFKKTIAIYSLDMYNEIYNSNVQKRSYLATKIHDLKYSNLKNDEIFVDSCLVDFIASINKIKEILDWKFDKILIIPQSEIIINQKHFMRKLARKLSESWNVSYEDEDIKYAYKSSQKTKNVDLDKRVNVAYEKFEARLIPEKRVLLLDDVIQTGSSMIALNNKLIMNNPQIEITNLGLVRTGMS